MLRTQIMPDMTSPWSMAVDPFDASDHIHPQEFDLLDRVIELVVKSGSFSGPLLAAALRLSDRKVARLTHELEELGVIARGAERSARAVLVAPADLTMFFNTQRARRRQTMVAA